MLPMYRDVVVEPALEADEVALDLFMQACLPPSIADHWTVSRWKKLPSNYGRGVWRVFGRGEVNEAGRLQLARLSREAANGER